MAEKIEEFPTMGSDGKSYTIVVVTPYELGPKGPDGKPLKNFGAPRCRVKGSNIPVTPTDGGFKGTIDGVEIFFRTT